MNWSVVFRGREYLKGSLWIVPVAGAVMGLLLAELGLRLDAAGVLPAYKYSPESLAAGGIILGLLLFMLFFDRFMHRMRPVAVAALMATECREAFDDFVREAARPDTAFVARGSLGPTSDPVYVVRATRAGTRRSGMQRRAEG